MLQQQQPSQRRACARRASAARSSRPSLGAARSTWSAGEALLELHSENVRQRCVQPTAGATAAGDMCCSSSSGTWLACNQLNLTPTLACRNQVLQAWHVNPRELITAEACNSAHSSRSKTLSS